MSPLELLQKELDYEEQPAQSEPPPLFQLPALRDEPLSRYTDQDLAPLPAVADEADPVEAPSAPEETGLWRGMVPRLAQKLAPLYSTLYDLQMQQGGGVRMLRHRLALRNYPPGAPGLKAAFIADLHYGPTSGTLAARQAWKHAREANPDIVLLGGDFVYADGSGVPALLRQLQRWKHAPPPAGIFACLGNHDRRGNSDALQTCLEACGVRVLVDDAVQLPPPWHGIWIAGTDDPVDGTPRIDQTLAKVPSKACTILLSHSPDICASEGPRRSSLTLCGHTHGGQVSWPRGGPVLMPSEWCRQYPAGLFRHAGSWLFVSRGVGTVGFPIRVFSPPDVALLQIGGAGASSAVSGRGTDPSYGTPRR